MPSYGFKKRDCAHKDSAKVRLPTAADGNLDLFLELNTALEMEDFRLHLGMIHTTHHHLVVSEVQTLGNVCEVFIVKHTTEHEDVARMLAINDDGSGTIV